jgi:hypothetical protein
VHRETTLHLDTLHLLHLLKALCRLLHAHNLLFYLHRTSLRILIELKTIYRNVGIGPRLRGTPNVLLLLG